MPFNNCNGVFEISTLPNTHPPPPTPHQLQKQINKIKENEIKTTSP